MNDSPTPTFDVAQAAAQMGWVPADTPEDTATATRRGVFRRRKKDPVSSESAATAPTSEAPVTEAAPDPGKPPAGKKGAGRKIAVLAAGTIVVLAGGAVGGWVVGAIPGLPAGPLSPAPAVTSSDDREDADGATGDATVTDPAGAPDAEGSPTTSAAEPTSSDTPSEEPADAGTDASTDVTGEESTGLSPTRSPVATDAELAEMREWYAQNGPGSSEGDPSTTGESDEVPPVQVNGEDITEMALVCNDGSACTYATKDTPTVVTVPAGKKVKVSGPVVSAVVTGGPASGAARLSYTDGVLTTSKVPAGKYRVRLDTSDGRAFIMTLKAT